MDLNVRYSNIDHVIRSFENLTKKVSNVWIQVFGIQVNINLETDFNQSFEVLTSFLSSLPVLSRFNRFCYV